MALSEKDKKKIFKEASFRICTNLKRGYSIHLSKALTRDALGLGYKLIDHIARSSMQVLDLQGSIKQEKLSKQTKT